MRRLGFAVAVLGVAALALGAVTVAAEEEASPRGQQVAEDLKCTLCHSVPAAGIESKTKSEKMKGADLLTGEWDAELLASYLKQEAKVDGEEHKKEFKGSDEELQVLVDWLLEQKAED